MPIPNNWGEIRMKAHTGQKLSRREQKIFDNYCKIRVLAETEHICDNTKCD